jgi:membrane associated rhomboid family serine protease
VSRYNRSSISGIGYPQWTPAVKTLIIICAVAYLLQIFDRIADGGAITGQFGLTPADVTQNFYLWQLVTYIFLHEPSSIFHILFNMLGLWMFGSDLERLWGSRQFVRFFFICGIGAGLLMVMLSPNSQTSTIGASGSIYGILLAYAMYFPNRIIIFIIFPIPAKWFVIILGGIAFFSSISATGGTIAHIAHLGGMLCGFIYLRAGSFGGDLRWRYNQWQRNRLRRKFDVYYNDRQKPPDDENPRWRRWR